MMDFIDRVPTKAGRRKLTFDDGETKYATVEMADEALVDGTPLNREVFMALQGFCATDTVFNEDGSITEINVLGETMVTTFNEDGSIEEVFTNANGLKIGKKTSFNEDGSISETLMEFEMEV